MADVTVVCATHDRAGQVKSFAAFGDDLLLSVAESQVEAYRAAYADARIDPHPDDVVGLPAKKNWLYRKYGDVFIVDDDARPMIDHQDSTRVEPKKAVELVHWLADMAEQMGASLFGFGSDEIPLHYQPQKPFTLTGMMGGGKFGLLAGSELWWPEEPKYGVCEDIWMGALNAWLCRYCLKDLRHVLPTSVGQKGGLDKIRTPELMEEVADFLVESFGDAIKLKKPEEAALYYWRLQVPW